MKERVTHLLDTSALVAHYQEEEGYEVVERIVGHFGNSVRVSSLTWLEFRLRLEQICPDVGERRFVFDHYRQMLGTGIPNGDLEVARAFLLRQAAGKRIPSIDRRPHRRNRC